MTRFLRPTGEDAFDVIVNGEVAGRVYRDEERHRISAAKWHFTARNGDTHIFGFMTPQEAAASMVETQEAGGAGAVQIDYERANGWSTD
jgi:hypothetical protein